MTQSIQSSLDSFKNIEKNNADASKDIKKINHIIEHRSNRPEDRNAGKEADSGGFQGVIHPLTPPL